MKPITAVVLDDCHVAAQGSGRKCAVYLEEIPNLLVIRNCQMTARRTCESCLT